MTIRSGHACTFLIATMTAMAACTTAQEKGAAETALDAMSDDQRRSALEATLRVFDEKPRYVDELYELTRKQHPRTLTEFLANSTRDLQDPQMARLTASLLVREPASVQQMLIASIDAIARVPEARAAMRRAIADRASETVDILSDDPAAMATLLEASLRMIERKPEAKKGALAAVHRDSRQIVEFLKNDPGLVKDMTGEVLGRALKQR